MSLLGLLFIGLTIYPLGCVLDADDVELTELRQLGLRVFRSTDGLNVHFSDDFRGRIEDWNLVASSARENERLELSFAPDVAISVDRLKTLESRVGNVVLLFFEGGNFEPEVVAELGQFINVEEAWLNGTTTDEASINRALRGMKKLQFVTLPHCCTDESIQIIANHGTIEDIYCRSEHLTVASIEALARCPNLIRLYFEDTNLRGKDFRSLQMHESLRDFRVPHLCRDEDMVEFARLTRLEKVAILRIDEFTNEGMRHIVTLPSLKSLTVDEGDLDNAVFDLLIECESLEELRLVDCNELDLSDLREFARKFERRYERAIVVSNRLH